MCPSPRLLVTRGVIWTPYNWLNKFCGAIIDVDSRCGLRIELCHRSQYISNKTERFSYKGECGVMHTEWFGL